MIADVSPISRDRLPSLPHIRRPNMSNELRQFNEIQNGLRDYIPNIRIRLQCRNPIRSIRGVHQPHGSQEFPSMISNSHQLGRVFRENVRRFNIAHIIAREHGEIQAPQRLPSIAIPHQRRNVPEFRISVSPQRTQVDKSNHQISKFWSALGQVPHVGEARECRICLEPIEEGEIQVYLFCFHEFHGKCIHQWLGQKLTCPICKIDLLEEYQKARKGDFMTPI